ncbi:MAG TPA: ABC transporter substrate-binding protein [Beijerinckiaceae bacterium]
MAASALVAASTLAAAQAPAGKPITLGMIAEQSGPLGYYGQETARSAQIFVDQVNAAGGVLGRPLRLVVRDSKTAVNEAVRQARDLAFTENVDFLVHSFNSAECVGVGNIAKQAKKILFSACANDDFTMKAGGRYIFRVPNITARTQGYAAADYAAQHLAGKGTRYYTIAHDFAFGRGVVDNFKERIKEKMPKVEFIGEAWPKLNEQAYAPFVTAMLNAKPDVVFYSWGFGVPYWQQAAPFDVLSQVPMVSSYWGGSDDLQIVPKNSVPTGAIMGGLPWYAIEGKANEDFVERFRKAHDKPPLTAAYLVLMNLQALKAGIEKAGVVDTEKVVDALEGLEFDSVIGRITIRPFDHQGAAPLWTGRAAWDETRKIGVLTEIVKLPTDLYLPSEEDVKKARQ